MNNYFKDTVSIDIKACEFRMGGEKPFYGKLMLHANALDDEELFLLLREYTEDWNRMELSPADEEAASRCYDSLLASDSPLGESRELKVYAEERFHFLEGKKRQAEILRGGLLLVLLALTAGLIAALTMCSLTFFETVVLICTYTACSIGLGAGIIIHFMRSPLKFAQDRPFYLERGEVLL